MAILDHDEPAFYCIPAPAFEVLMEKLEDVELNKLADARSGQAEIKVDISEL